MRGEREGEEGERGGGRERKDVRGVVGERYEEKMQEAGKQRST
jgi:hypothetical protein